MVEPAPTIGSIRLRDASGPIATNRLSFEATLVILRIRRVAATAALALRRLLGYLGETDTKYWTLRSQIERFEHDSRRSQRDEG